MRALWKIGVAALVFGYFAACSPVKFDKVPPAPCGSEGVVCVQTCTGDGCFQEYSTEKTVGEGKVDVLIVNDNSGSMSFEQRKMGERFGDFLASLARVDYRIAMTTTDISSAKSSTPVGVKNRPGPYNGNGALQDGRLINFGGQSFLDRNTPNKEALFNQEIVRRETLHCEQSGFTECPSSDERGIFAANLVLDNAGTTNFIRPDAHLAVVVLADEEERGMSTRSARSEEDQQLAAMYPVEEYDKPETFVSKFSSKFPGKTVAVHSIIVRPGDLACAQAQSAQGNFVRGTEGYAYADLSNLTGGKIGSICENDYSSQLRAIGSEVMYQALSFSFVCRPKNDDFEVTIEPKQAQDVEVEADFSKLTLEVKTRLPTGTKVRVDYKCFKEQK